MTSLRNQKPEDAQPLIIRQQGTRGSKNKASTASNAKRQSPEEMAQASMVLDWKTAKTNCKRCFGTRDDETEYTDEDGNPSLSERWNRDHSYRWHQQIEGRDEETLLRWTELYRRYSGNWKAPITGAAIPGEPKPLEKTKTPEQRVLDFTRPLMRQNPTVSSFGTISAVLHPDIADYTSAARADLRRKDEIHKANKVHRQAHIDRLRMQGKDIFRAIRPCAAWIHGDCSKGTWCDFLHDTRHKGIIAALPTFNERNPTDKRNSRDGIDGPIVGSDLWVAKQNVRPAAGPSTSSRINQAQAHGQEKEPSHADQASASPAEMPGYVTAPNKGNLTPEEIEEVWQSAQSFRDDKTKTGLQIGLESVQEKRSESMIERSESRAIARSEAANPKEDRLESKDDDPWHRSSTKGWEGNDHWWDSRDQGQDKGSASNYDDWSRTSTKSGRIQTGGQASRKKNHQDENGFADPLELYMTRKMPNNAASFTQKDCANGVKSATSAIPRRASPEEILGSSKDNPDPAR